MKYIFSAEKDIFDSPAFLQTMPPFHIAGWIYTTMYLAWGRTLVLYSSVDLEQLLHVLKTKQYKASIEILNEIPIKDHGHLALKMSLHNF